MKTDSVHVAGGANQGDERSRASDSHTPGPWRVGVSGNVHGGGFTLAELGGIYPEKSANARLIAAAPDLLAALEDLLEQMASGADIVALNDARAAFAKAKGRDGVARHPA